MAAPTEKEQELLEKFRQNINDLDLNKDQLTDMFLITWIRARENDLGKAEDMLRKSMKWRVDNEIETIYEWEPPEYYLTQFPYKITGLDNDGRPVGVIPLGKWDVRTEIESGGRQTYIRYVDQLLMRFMKHIKEHCSKNGQTQFTVLVDLKGMALRQVTSPAAVDTVLDTFRRFEGNFPETLKTAYIVNAPRIFPMAYALVKPLLSLRTQEKIQIFNSNESKWKPVLLANIPASTLPTPYGGTGTKYNDVLNGISGSGANETIEEGLVKVTVAAGEKHFLEYNIDFNDACLKWEFRTDHYDIGFSVLYEEIDHVPYRRCESHLKKESGFAICPKPGKYTMVFDNTYSRLREKSLSYLVTISGGGLEEAEDEENNNTKF